MGVRGLFAFVKDVHDMFKRVKLQDCTVVLDASNVMHSFSAECSKELLKFGGEYDELYDRFHDTFVKMSRCGINVIVILDGSFDAIKLPTLLRRQVDKNAASTSSNPTRPPHLMADVFLAAMRDVEGVQVHRHLYEADLLAAEVASYLNCPVMSMDSDFLLSDVRLILPSHLEFFERPGPDCPGGPARARSRSRSKQQQEQKLYMECKEFDRQKFLRRFRLKNCDLLPLFGSLIGNDYIASKVCERVFAQIQRLKSDTKSVKSEAHKKMFRLLDWLSKQSCCEEAMDALLKAVPAGDRPRLAQKLRDSIEMYSFTAAGGSGAGFADWRELAAAVAAAKGGDRGLDADLLKAIEVGGNTGPLNIVFNRTILLPSLVEALEFESPHQFAFPILQEYVRVVLLVAGDPEGHLAGSVRVYMRERGSIRSVSRLVLPDEGPAGRDGNLEQTIPPLEAPLIRDRAGREAKVKLVLMRRALFLSKAQADDLWLQLGKFRPEHHLVILAIRFWWWRSKETPLAAAVGAAGLSAQLLAVLTSISAGSVRNLKAALRRNNDEVADSLWRRLWKRRDFDNVVAHSLSNLVASIHHLYLISEVLGNPLEPVRYHELLSGFILHGLSQVFGERPGELLQEVSRLSLDCYPVFEQTFRDVQDCILKDVVPLGSSADNSPQKGGPVSEAKARMRLMKKRAKEAERRANNLSKPQNDSCKLSAEAEASPDDDPDPESFFDMSNKFSGLLL